MTTEQYLIHLKKLGLPKIAASRVFGVSPRQAQRFASGELPIPVPVAKLVAVMVRHRVSADEVEALT